MYGSSNKCRGGKGGPWANDVYVINGIREPLPLTGHRCPKENGYCVLSNGRDQLEGRASSHTAHFTIHVE